MKIVQYFMPIILLVILVGSCIKGESYCELPPRVIDAFEFGSMGNIIAHAPSDEIRIYTGREEEEGTTREDVLYSFSTPDYFINPKGDYTEDVVNSEEYLYVLKDTNVYADTIPIVIYSFNDCGRSTPYHTIIVFD